jgi:hypothetical protein
MFLNSENRLLAKKLNDNISINEEEFYIKFLKR